MLTRDQILATEDLTTEKVKVPEWGGSVIIRELTGTERDAWESSIVKADAKGNITFNSKNMRARLLSIVAVDEKGKQLFTSKDIEALGAKSAKIVDRLFQVAQRVSALTNKDIEDLESKSTADQPEGSTST